MRRLRASAASQASARSSSAPGRAEGSTATCAAPPVHWWNAAASKLDEGRSSSTLPTRHQPGFLPQRLSASDLWQAVNRRSRVPPAVVEPPPLPWLHRPPPRRHLQLQLQARPPHYALAVALRQELEELAPAASTLEGVELPARHEVQEDPSPLPRRLARALLASCLTMARCALAPVRRAVRCCLLRTHWQALKRRSRVREHFGDEYLGLDTRLARRCACPKSLALFPCTPGSSTRW